VARRELLLVLVAGVAIVAGACDSRTSASEELRPDSLVETGILLLEETDSTPIIRPNLWVGRRGQVIVVEPRLASVRIHSRDGALEGVLGRRGEGPGEFLSPIAAVGDDETVWVLDVQKGLSEWDLASRQIRRPMDLEHALGLNLTQVGDSLLAVAGFTPGPMPWTLLNTVSTTSAEVHEQFMNFEVPEVQRGLAMTLASVPLAVSEDGSRLYTTHSWSDTVRIYSPGGELLRSVGIPIPGFSREGTVPSSETLASLRVVRQLGVSPRGDLVVQYATPRIDQQDEDRGLLLVSRDGEVLHALGDSPRLLHVRWPDLFFSDSTGLHPGRILVMQYR